MPNNSQTAPEEEVKFPEWIFTFGFSHVDPETGERLANHFIRISAETAQEARQKM